MAKKNTFKQWREAQEQETIVLIRKALLLIANSKYNNVTRMAKDVAGLVTEFRIQANNALPPEKQKKITPTSYTTLQRNSAYSKIINVAFEESTSSKGNLPQNPSISAVDVLQAKIASLETTIANLKARIRSIDTNGSSSIFIEHNDSNQNQENQQLIADIRLLLKLLDGVNSEVGGALVTVRAENICKERPIAGWYGPFNLIATWDELSELLRIRDEYSERNQ